MITFNNQYFGQLESANYFGNDGGMHQSIVRTAWIDRMMDEGYQFGCEYDETDIDFQSDTQKCLRDAIELAAA